ncbi:CBS domain-containing protein [Halococcoides cellulosivorans]|uniref:Zinc metalloprotease n=1 Tax=Halococcoides cellulosivorans TaxID=1679096 RepID=A0A2R4X057_9EURY|nr:CBS domain-containing protein [Halococcoides cellulosivorans]AWB27155.1 metalloprotease [Halococcoides cellulosivorans]
MPRLTIGRAFGIPIRLDITFVLVLPLLAWLIGSEVGNWVEIIDAMGVSLAAETLEAGLTPWILGTVAAIGLFAGVVAHELGHSLVAMHYGYPIESITLWIFGGIAKLEEMPEHWSQELAVALAGPAVSLAIAGLAFLALPIVPVSGTITASIAFVLGYLALMNLVLAAFNLLPGFPMDGGRVLRALLARTRPYAQATQIAARVGKMFAVVLGLLGLFVLGNLFLVAIAFFIYLGAAGEAQMTVMKAAFEGVEVRDVMTPADRIATVDAEATVADLVDRMVRERHTGYPVVEGDRILGIVTLDDARAVREVEREAFTVREVMTTDLETIAPGEDAMSALTRLQSRNVGRLLVYEDDEFRGLITRSDLMTAFDVIQSSGWTSPETTLAGQRV